MLNTFDRKAIRELVRDILPIWKNLTLAIGFISIAGAPLWLFLWLCTYLWGLR